MASRWFDHAHRFVACVAPSSFWAERKIPRNEICIRTRVVAVIRRNEAREEIRNETTISSRVQTRPEEQYY